MRACASRATSPSSDPATRSHVLHLYGSLAEEMLAPALIEPALLAPIHALTRPMCSRRSATQREHEWAVSVEDVVWRRTTLGYRGLADAAAAPVAEGTGTRRHSGPVYDANRDAVEPRDRAGRDLRPIEEIAAAAGSKPKEVEPYGR